MEQQIAALQSNSLQLNVQYQEALTNHTALTQMGGGVPALVASAMGGVDAMMGGAMDPQLLAHGLEAMDPQLLAHAKLREQAAALQGLTQFVGAGRIVGTVGEESVIAFWRDGGLSARRAEERAGSRRAQQGRPVARRKSRNGRSAATRQNGVFHSG